MHCVDLGESFQDSYYFQTHIYLQNLASIQPRTSPVKFAQPSRFPTQARNLSSPWDGEPATLLHYLQEQAIDVVWSQLARLRQIEEAGLAMRSGSNKDTIELGSVWKEDWEKGDNIE